LERRMIYGVVYRALLGEEDDIQSCVQGIAWRGG